MKRINESLIYQGKLNILRFQLNISAEDIYFASCHVRVFFPTNFKMVDISKSPVILRVLQIQKGQGNLTEQEFLCSVE